MKRDSDIFDRIRIARDADEERLSQTPACEHPGCAQLGKYRAPKGRRHEGEYWNFCLEHVRAYNLSYDYFSGMPDEAVASFQKSSLTGHRPTWAMGVKAWARRDPLTSPEGQMNPWAEGDRAQFLDPFGFFRDYRRRPEPQARPVRNVERKAFGTLNLEVTATAREIKVRYKEMVKRFHPDANGGDRSLEDKLREIIAAYSHLKNAGFC